MQKGIASPKTTLLLIVALLCLLSGRIFQITFLLFLFPVFAISYLRRANTQQGFLRLLGASVAVSLTAFWGVRSHMFSSVTVYVVVMTVSAFVGLIPILLDAFLFKKGVNQAWLILVYPCFRVFLEFLESANSPFGIWGSDVYFLASSQPLNNLVAYGGIWALSLFISLAASLLVYIQENGFRKSAMTPRIVLWCVWLMALSAIAGWVRIKNYQPGSDVRVAVVLANDSLKTASFNKMHEHLLSRRQIGLSSVEVSYFHHAFEVSNNDIFRKIKKAAETGAKIIFCAESNMVVLKEDEKQLTETAKKIALEKSVYIGLAAEVYAPASIKPVENKIIFIQPNGIIDFTYYKHFPIGIEKEVMVTGDGTIPTCHTPYGTITAVNSVDTDLITYARKTGKAEADILFAPSDDWNAIAELRGKITCFRALENGYTLVRPASHGVTEMVAPTGHVIYANNYSKHPLQLMLADIPTNRLSTFYVQTGDWLPFLLLFILLGVLFGFWRKIKMSRSHTAGFRLIILSITVMPSFLQAQVVFSDSSHKLPSSHTENKNKTVLFPALSYSPETNLALGVSAMHFYKQSADARVSQINANFLYTFNRQFINEVSLLQYSVDNHYLVKAGFSCNSFPEKFYGISNNATEENEVTLHYNVIKTDISLMKRILKNTYTGIFYKYANYYNICQEAPGAIKLDTLNGGYGNIQSGLGVQLLHDSRESTSNSTKGWYGLLDVSWNNIILGSVTNYLSLDADIRKYHKLRSGAVFAWQGLIQIKQGEVPFTQLSYLGGENIMRGFYSGRYRDNDLVAAQAEYRRHLWRNWGFVLFAGAGKVGKNWDDVNMNNMHHSIGFGLRRTISKQQKLNLRLDVGYGNGQCNFYINIGEAF